MLDWLYLADGERNSTVSFRGEGRNEMIEERSMDECSSFSWCRNSSTAELIVDAAIT